MPTTSSLVYSGPISVSASKTIQAIAVATGLTTSNVGSAVYTITQQAAMPTFTPASGTYTSNQNVTISTTTPAATIYYTTDGSTPTTSSQVYSGPITVAGVVNVQAISMASGLSMSPVGTATYAITPPAATPAFSPAAGTYTSTQSVTISTTTPSATIYYTTDGSTPTTSSHVYSGPVTVSSTETIQAIAAANKYSVSAVGSAAYSINPPAVTPSFSPAGGTYTSTQTVTISTTTPSATIYYTTNGATPTTGSSVYSGPIAVSSTETVKAMATATGYSASTTNSAAYTINPPSAAPFFSPAGGTYTSTQTVTISTTTPSATIYYTTNGSTPTTSSQVYSGPITVSATETVQAIAVASGYSTSTVNSAVYTITPPAAAPSFSPAGGSYTSTQTVTISSTIPSATIHYTTNGSKPTANSPVYSGPITVSTTETVKAIAMASGYVTSDISSANYTITAQTGVPTFSPAGGQYTSAQTVTISTTDSSAVIYYTTDGSTPTTSSTAYSGPISVAATETITAIAVEIKPGSGQAKRNATQVASPVSSAIYTINLAAPGFSVTVFPTSVSVSKGKSAKTAVLVTPQNGFSSPVYLSCSGLPAGASCNFSSTSITPSGGVESVTLTVDTTTMTASVPHDFSPSIPGSALALVFCCFGWKRRRSLDKLLPVIAVAVGLGLCTGCGVEGRSLDATTSTVTVIATNGSLQPSTSLMLTLK
jgi:Chitobiase/beta-hexosaminidase C-terminal domain